MKKAQVDMVTAGLSSDFYQMNKNTTKDRVGNFGVVMKGLPNVKPIPIIRDERADFGKATVRDEQFTNRWIHKLDEKPHSYYAGEFGPNSAGGSKLFSPRIKSTRPFGTYIPGFHGPSNDPNSTIGGVMAKRTWNQQKMSTKQMASTQPVYKIGDKEHRRALSMNSQNHHYLYPNQDAKNELKRILDPEHRAHDMNNSFYMRGQKFIVNPYNKC